MLLATSVSHTTLADMKLFNYPILQYMSLCSSSLCRCGHHCTHTALLLTTMFSLCPSEIDALNSLHNFTFKYGQPMWEQLSKYVALAQIFLKNYRMTTCSFYYNSSTNDKFIVWLRINPYHFQFILNYLLQSFFFFTLWRRVALLLIISFYFYQLCTLYCELWLQDT